MHRLHDLCSLQLHLFTCLPSSTAPPPLQGIFYLLPTLTTDHSHTQFKENTCFLLLSFQSSEVFGGGASCHHLSRDLRAGFRVLPVELRVFAACQPNSLDGSSGWRDWKETPTGRQNTDNNEVNTNELAGDGWAFTCSRWYTEMSEGGPFPRGTAGNRAALSLGCGASAIFSSCGSTVLSDLPDL